ncbi:MAG: C4-type zinc ribbon domain-containing protein [Verrucomicrobiota bacterium]
MLESIEKLLVLQDRDRNIAHVKEELERIPPERQFLQARAHQTQASLDAAKLRVKQIESQRKDLELEVDAQKQKIAKYSIQQFETKKNDEFKAIGNEIGTCKANITKIEDQQLDLMEKAEAAQKEVATSNQAASEAKKHVDGQIADLDGREENLKKELAELLVNRETLAEAVEEGARARYDRLVKNKGGNVVVGIQHGVCGGCHMKFPIQIVLSCKREEDIITCPNCGRILYYTRDMDMAVAD